MNWDDDLTEPHLSIAGSTAARMAILAGPGTGKTSFGLMRRVVRLLAEGVPGERILLISFTRVAAADLRDKVQALSAPNADRVQARTLHGYCFSLLQKDAVLELTGRTPRILMKHEVDLMLRDIGGDFGDIFARRRLLEAFQAGWARGESDHPGLAAEDDEVAFEHAVIRWLRDHKAMLIGEVVPLAYKYLRDNPLAEERQAFDHVIVDEYQDLNLLEQSLLGLLAEDGSLCVAGDDDQSIYSLRYANPTGIIDFMNREDVEQHSILVCGRCPEQILSMANSTIGQAPGRNKEPSTCRDPGLMADVSILQWESVDEEIAGIASAIAGDVATGTREPGEILVLTNWRHVGEGIRRALADAEVPAQSFFAEEELGAASAQEAMALLRLAADPEDLASIRVVVGLGDAQGRADAYRRLTAHSQTARQSNIDTFEQIRAGQRIAGLNVRAIGDRYVTLMLRLAELKRDDLHALLEEIMPASNLDLADLRSLAAAHIPEAVDVADLVRLVITDITQDEVPQTPNFVRIMSLHKSKGLTSPCVYVVGTVQGVVPSVPPRSTPGERAAAEEEGRRLFYVALTRSSNQLVISSAITLPVPLARGRNIILAENTIRRSGSDLIARALPSQYIAELGVRAPAAQAGVRWIETRRQK